MQQVSPCQIPQGRPRQQPPVGGALHVRAMHYYKPTSPNHPACIECGQAEDHEDHYRPRPHAIERSEQWSKEVRGKAWPGQSK